MVLQRMLIVSKSWEPLSGVCNILIMGVLLMPMQPDKLPELLKPVNMLSILAGRKCWIPTFHWVAILKL